MSGPESPVRARSPCEDTAGPVYSEMISDARREESDRKTSLEQRGGFVISTSGALVTLLIGVLAVANRPEGAQIPAPAREHLSWAMFAFAGAAVLAVFTNLPLLYGGADPDILRERVQLEMWQGRRDVAARRVAEMWVTAIESAQRQNGRKGWALFAGFLLEVAAVALLAWTVSDILRQ